MGTPPKNTTRPPAFTMKMLWAWAELAGLAEMTLSAPTPPVSFFTASMGSSLVELMVTSTPNCLDISRRESLMSIIMTFWAPRILASWDMKQPMGPAPMMTRVSG